MRGINISETLLIILYVRNLYKGFFICASMSIKMKCYMFKTIDELKGLTRIPIFLIKLFYSFTLLLFNFHANYCQYQIKSNYCTYSYTQ